MLKPYIVVVPIYKSVPNWSELISFNQCLKILFNHPICIITYNGLDISYYKDLLVKSKAIFRIEYFNKSFFENIDGYNKLMLSQKFYKRFINFEYILLYQLDAWIFRDELAYWCQKGYDYIGAPWFEYCGSYENGNKLWTVGNGGFSLRRIPSFLNIFYCKEPFFKICELKTLYPQGKTFIKKVRRIIVIYLKSSGLKNNNRFFIKKWTANEDGFWCLFYQKSKRPLKIPKCEEAINFSFEKSPKYLYELNERKLPFGCHGWNKYEYNTFWINFISDRNLK